MFKNKTLLAVGFMQLLLVPDLPGESLKRNEVTTLANLATFISEYQRHTQKLPASWGEMHEGGFLGDSMLNSARRSLDFERRYRFPSSERPLIIGYFNEKIIVMAIESGLEGDFHKARDGHDAAGRWTIVEMPSGDLQTRHFPEEHLELYFQKAGFKLADYTGTGGKWLPVKEIPGSKPDAQTPGNRTPPEPGQVKRGGGSDASDHESNRSGLHALRNIPWMYGLMGVLGFAVLAGMLLFLVQKRQR